MIDRIGVTAMLLFSAVMCSVAEKVEYRLVTDLARYPEGFFGNLRYLRTVRF